MSKERAAKEPVREKPIALQLHEHLQQHKDCSVETCAVNAALREAYRKQYLRGVAHSQERAEQE